MHSSAGFSPLDVTVSPLPVHLAILNVTSAGEAFHSLQREQCVERHNALMAAAYGNIRRAREVYKSSLDRAVRPSTEYTALGNGSFLTSRAAKGEGSQVKQACVTTDGTLTSLKEFDKERFHHQFLRS